MSRPISKSIRTSKKKKGVGKNHVFFRKEENMEKKKVLIGMSGGVDSSVSALLLKQQGYEVIGATMSLWEDKENPNHTLEEAKRVCDALQIPFYPLYLEKEFNKYVVQNFIQEYQEARTPNPCVQCNRYLKFGLFLAKAKELGCQYVATGHYVRTSYLEKYNQVVLQKAPNNKDQSYFLYAIPKEVLPMLVFPLQKYTSKEEIREIAKENHLPVAEKKDSQEICFIPDGDYGCFLRKNGIGTVKKGDFVLKDGTKLGEHKGLIYYTIGQRKGLGISYKEPLYVICLDKKENKVVLGTEPELYKSSFTVSDVHLLVEKEKMETLGTMQVKIRYRAKEADCKIEWLSENRIKVLLDKPQKSITPGQSAVLYDGDVVLGGGIIEE